MKFNTFSTTHGILKNVTAPLPVLQVAIASTAVVTNVKVSTRVGVGTGGRGTTIRYFDKSARRKLERVCGRRVIRKLESWLDSYVVEADGAVITAGRRYKHIRK